MMRPGNEVYAPYSFDRIYDYNGPFKQAIPIAEHYGFRLVKPIHHSKRNDDVQLSKENKLSSIKYFLEQSQESLPALICHTRASRRKRGFLNLEIFGHNDSFAEVMLLKTAASILEKDGVKDMVIEINSFGSEESFLRFYSNLKEWVEKHLESFPRELQRALKADPLALFDLEGLDEDLEDLRIRAPRPTACLSENCRLYFKDLFEYMETSGLPYQLNPQLFPFTHRHAETVFCIRDGKDNIIAYGERYNTHARNLIGQDIDAASITIALKGGKTESYKKVDPKDLKIPSVYFAYIGAEAKQRALTILDVLHQSGLNVRQAVVKKSLREQLYYAERQNIPYLVIMGVKEAQEGTVIVRNNITNSQRSISINRLPNYLNRLVS